MKRTILGYICLIAWLLLEEISSSRPNNRQWIQANQLRLLIVPPSNATIVSKIQEEGAQARVSLNCSSFGLPAPSLQWNIGDDKRAQADFTGRAWNATSKLWQVWSFLSYTPADHQSTVTCTPVATVGGESVKGISAEYNSSRRLSASLLISAAILVSLFLR